MDKSSAHDMSPLVWITRVPTAPSCLPTFTSCRLTLALDTTIWPNPESPIRVTLVELPAKTICPPATETTPVAMVEFPIPSNEETLNVPPVMVTVPCAPVRSPTSKIPTSIFPDSISKVPTASRPTRVSTVSSPIVIEPLSSSISPSTLT